jgi:uncharacterized RDD family membrane protein YckC
MESGKKNINRNIVTIETPDKIKLDYQAATPFLRFSSYIIDFFIYILLIILMFYLFYYFDMLNDLSEVFDQEYFAALSYFFIFVLFFLFRWGYFIFFETVFNGKTIGKMIFRLRTIHYQGKYLDIKAIILRNFTRLIDELPFALIIIVPIPALFCIIFSRHFRRIGDLIAGTVVVKENSLQTRPPDFGLNQSDQQLQTLLQILRERATNIIISRLSEQELYILKRFLNTLHQFRPDKRAVLLKNLAETVKNRTGDSENYDNPEIYLRTIYMRHQNGNKI